MGKPDTKWLAKDRLDRRAGDRIRLTRCDAVVLAVTPTAMHVVMLDAEGARVRDWVDPTERLLEGLALA